MSYKFVIRRCVECAAVWFDPPRLNDEPTRCRVVYVAPNGHVRTCGGTVREFALVDCDMFVTTFVDWWKE